MRCFVPTCFNDDASCISSGITFHEFPTEPSQAMAWVMALDMEDCKIPEKSVICSNHFVKNDLYIDGNGQCRVREDAVPVVNVNFTNNGCWRPCDVKVCRICFIADCNLYQMTMYNKLDRAYEILTGLSIVNEDNLPSYLCMECAQRLLNCIHFRDRSLRAHLMLLETIKKHDHITIETLKSTSGNLNLFRSSLSVKHMPIDHYDLKIEHKHSDEDDTENIERKKQEELINTINSDLRAHDISVMRRIKSEVLETSNHDNNETIVTNEPECLPKLILDSGRIKTETDMFDKDSFNDTTNVEMQSDKGGLHALEDESFEEKNNVRKIVKLKNAPNNSTSVQDIFLNGITEANHFSNHKLSPDLCPYQTAEELPLLKNLKKHSKVKRFNCDICDYNTNSKLYLNKHKKKHSIQKTACHICKKIINTQGMTRHMRIHTGEKPFTCAVCSKAFKRQDHYKSHLKIHSNEKPYSCDICNQGFSRQDHYKTHLKLHSQNNLCYTCDVCKKSFNRKSNLQNHMNLHTGEKPYSCKLCKKAFRRNSNLRIHLILHSKKPHSCDLCWKYFSRKSGLKKHMHKRHKKNMSYTCNECDNVFISKITLREHLIKYCVNFKY